MRLLPRRAHLLAGVQWGPIPIDLPAHAPTHCTEDTAAWGHGVSQTISQHTLCANCASARTDERGHPWPTNRPTPPSWLRAQTTRRPPRRRAHRSGGRVAGRPPCVSGERDDPGFRSRPRTGACMGATVICPRANAASGSFPRFAAHATSARSIAHSSTPRALRGTERYERADSRAEQFRPDA
jgi:hypothetical protein